MSNIFQVLSLVIVIYRAFLMILYCYLCNVIVLQILLQSSYYVLCLKFLGIDLVFLNCAQSIFGGVFLCSIQAHKPGV